jgi:2'-5' RNA ligase
MPTRPGPFRPEGSCCAMPATTRTFVALEIPAALGEKLRRLQERLAPEAAGVRWVSTLPFHLTLAFLGDVPHADLNAVCLAVAGAAAAFGPFPLLVEGLGAFPDPSRPRVLWVGASGPGLEVLGRLHEAVCRATAGLGYPADDAQRFHPHVTLGRLKPGKHAAQDLGPLVKHFRTWSAGKFTAAEAVTFGSTLTTDGPEYTPLGRAPFRARKPDTPP